MSKTLVLIPARMASTRLPGKPLAEIAGKPMILHVLERANEAGIGVPYVCTDSREVHECVTASGGNAVMTREDHPSGSDRIWEAVTQIDPGAEAEFVVNVQGDLPTIDPALIRASLQPLVEGPADIATLATLITQEDERTNPNVVKAVGAFIGRDRMRALYFTRATAPWCPPGEQAPLYHHIGLYAYRRQALQRFVSLPPSALELREKLEQLRALENAMRIDIAVVDTAPLGVDTPNDLEKARQLLAKNA
jgi:3-deoxy-manno-octulosonate cytidylyltransferase (CMP-KDO synthetase)